MVCYLKWKDLPRAYIMNTVTVTWSFASPMTIPATIALCGSTSLSVIVVCLKDPVRVKLVPFWLKVTDTESFSLFCFFSRQRAKAQPTAWLRRSPCRHNNSRCLCFTSVMQFSFFFQVVAAHWQVVFLALEKFCFRSSHMLSLAEAKQICRACLWFDTLCL